MANFVSIKQVLLNYKRKLNEKEIWSLLLACYQDYYRKVKQTKTVDFNLSNLDISSENVYLELTGEAIIKFKNNSSNDDSLDGDLNGTVNEQNKNYENYERRFAYSLGCFLSYLIKLNDDLVDISDELRTLIAYMVDENNDCSFSYIFDEAYRCSCIHLDASYQKYIKKLYEKTLQRIISKTTHNDHELLDDTQNPAALYSQRSAKPSSLKDLDIAEYAPNETTKYSLLIDNIRKRKVMLKVLRAKINGTDVNRTTNDYSDDSNSELDDLETILTQSEMNFNESSSAGFMYNNNNRAVNTTQNRTIMSHHQQQHYPQQKQQQQQLHPDTTVHSSVFNMSSFGIRSINGRKFYDIRRIPQILRFDDPLQSNRKDNVTVVVKLITESKFELKCSLQSTCKQIFEYIIAYLDLNEQNLFGLFILFENEYFYIDFDDKLSKIFTKWKRKDTAIELYFKIKIFMDDINVLNDPLTLQFYYWELRRQFTNGYFTDINEDRISPTDELPRIFQLAVLAFHAEGGDLSELNYLYNNYVPERYMTEVSLFEIQICELFKTIHENQTSYQSLVQFTSFIMAHKNYGYHFYQYHSITQNNLQVDKIPSFIGLSLNGITVFKYLFSTVNKEQKSLLYKWTQIEKLLVEKKKIVIQLREQPLQPDFSTYHAPPQVQSKRFGSSSSSSFSAQNKITVNINSEKKSKAILKLSQTLSRHHNAVQQRNISKINNMAMFETYSNQEHEQFPMFTNSMVIEDPDVDEHYQLPPFPQQQLQQQVIAIPPPLPPPPQLASQHQQLNTSIMNNKHDIESEVGDETDFLLKEYFTNEKYLSYIKFIEINKVKNQTLGILIDEDTQFKYKFLKRIYYKNELNKNFEVGDIVLAINNSIEFNQMKPSQLEVYLNNYNGVLCLLMLSKENLNKLLNEYQRQNDGKQRAATTSSNAKAGNPNANTSLSKHHDKSDSRQADLKSEERFVNFTAFGAGNTKLGATVVTNSVTTDKDHGDSPTLSVDELIAQNIFKVTIQKNDNNELGFTIKKLPNAYSCIHELISEPAVSNRSLKVGDIILKINDTPTNVLSHHDIVTLIKYSSKNIKLELYRSNADFNSDKSNNTASKSKSQSKGKAAKSGKHATQTDYFSMNKFDTSLDFNDTLENEETNTEENTIVENKKLSLYENVLHQDAISEAPSSTVLQAPTPYRSQTSAVPPLHLEANPPQVTTTTTTLLEFEYDMKDFLELNLILSVESIQSENDDDSDINFSATTPPIAVLYVKSIKDFGPADENLKKNDVIIKLNNNLVNSFDEFKLILYNLNKANQLKEIHDPVRLLVKRKVTTTASSGGGSAAVGTPKTVQNFALNDVNYKNYVQSLNSSISSIIQTRPVEIENFTTWFTSTRYTQFFFPLYSNDNVINEEYLQSYSNFRNINADRVKQLVDFLNSKIFKNQEYLAEFKQFKATTHEVDSSKIANYNDENRAKNRYRNVVPYDYNRVKLQLYDTSNQTANATTNDYINASHICLPLNIFKEEELHELRYITKFIISQPPLNNTINDFLQMIWEQNAYIIVKLMTNEEINKIKCPKYWPTTDHPIREFPPFFQLSLISTQSLDEHIQIYYCTIQNLKLNKQRNIFICQYTDEFQITTKTEQDLHTNPQYTSQYNRLQTFINLIHIYHQKGPLLVYCQSGIGRTGIFLCIYYNLILFKCDFNANCNKLNFIHDTIKLLRTQRYGIIQNKYQLKFCYQFFYTLFQLKSENFNSNSKKTASK